MITYQYQVNMTPGRLPVRVKLNQYDDDWTIVFSLYTDSGDFTIESGTTAKIRGTKRDGLGYSANSTLDIATKKVTVSGDKQITAVSGENIFELVLYKGNKELSTANVIFYVEPAAMDAETLVSDSQVQEILDMSADVIAASANVSTLRGNFAPAYSSSVTYVVGDYVMHDNQLYRCTTAITTAEAWTPAHWTTVSLGPAVSDLKSALSSLAELTSENLIANATWTDGQYIRVNDGAAGNLENWAATSYIPVKPNTTYTLTKNEYMQGCVYTDTVSSARSNSFNPSTSINTFTVQTGENDRYIRLSCPIADKNVAGVYEIYCENPILKDNVEIPQLTPINTALLERLNVVNTAVNPTNYQTILPDVNNVLTNSVYKMYFDLRSTSIPLHLPFDRWITNQPVSLITFGVNIGGNAGIQQLLIGVNFIFIRSYGSSWTDWYAHKLEVNVGSGYQVVQHFTSLTEAVVFATKYRNATVNVYNGTFDLFQEFLDFYGADFFVNFGASTKPRGLHLTNNVRLKFGGYSKVLFNYDGNNAHVKQQFSPFNFLSDCVDGFTLENATVECSNCRYVVHDDPGDTSRAYHNKYKNCHFTIDNSNNDAWFSSRVIGGGLGRSAHVVVDGCVCIDNTADHSGAVVSYHNDAYTNVGKSRVEITGSYMIGGTIAALYDGTSTEKTVFIISNNSIPSAIIHDANQASSTIDNIDIYDWGNVVRT